MINADVSRSESIFLYLLKSRHYRELGNENIYRPISISLFLSPFSLFFVCVFSAKELMEWSMILTDMYQTLEEQTIRFMDYNPNI